MKPSEEWAPRSWLFRALVIASSSVLSLLLAEFALLPALVLDMPRREFLLGFAALPGITIDDITINSLGFTGDVPAAERSPAACAS